MSTLSPSLDDLNPPVFVVGCARSGTTLLYHTLLSSGGFAVYLAEPAVFDLLVPKFRDLAVLKNRTKLMLCWLNSKMFRASGLDRDLIEAKILSECKSNGDFLVILMREIARSQRKHRWAVWGPDNLLYIPQIKKELPQAKFIHMIRDGRDVALSLHKEQWIRSLPWDHHYGLLVAALHWLWKVNRGRKYGQRIEPDYLEVRFEDLLTEPQQSLLRISQFVHYDLDYGHIQKNALGTLKESNSSFRSLCGEGQSQPMGRWRMRLSPAEIDLLESVLGPVLLELGYPVTRRVRNAGNVGTQLRRIIYSALFDAKLWCKINTPLGRLVDSSRLRLEQEVT